jgi:hypothetical protein
MSKYPSSNNIEAAYTTNDITCAWGYKEQSGVVSGAVRAKKGRRESKNGRMRNKKRETHTKKK